MKDEEEKDNRGALADFRLPVLKIDCYACDRHGRYDVSRLIKKYGADLPIGDFIATARNSCRRYAPHRIEKSCAAGCDDLHSMWTPQPYTPEYPEYVRKLEEDSKKK